MMISLSDLFSFVLKSHYWRSINFLQWPLLFLYDEMSTHMYRFKVVPHNMCEFYDAMLFFQQQNFNP